MNLFTFSNLYFLLFLIFTMLKIFKMIFIIYDVIWLDDALCISIMALQSGDKQ